MHKYTLKMAQKEQIHILIDMGIPGQNNEIFIGREEIFQFLAQAKIGVCHIVIYMSLLHRRCQMLGLVGLFGFLCPSGISPVAQFKKGEIKKVEEDQRACSEYIKNTLFKVEATKGRVFLAPYNVGIHWVLCVIDPYNDIVYFLDPLHNENNKGTGNGIGDDLRSIVDRALFGFRSEKGLLKKIKMSTKWVQIQCPRQNNGVDCGYYVMRFMKEIIDHKQT
ncbi:uncharacterized protein LOC110734025 [Chenopodium quinoa]|uniref:uncharacterized protein LOC110734025 n=1 Tax=Chenopodium quinoa TaxID=63459 RepID=UPI000B796382|nr:uncharacterized protein LOC110734025 [Chenopodium quinoa]